VGEGLALDIVDAFLSAKFEGGRHQTRVGMIEGP
jgi:ribose 5-phosphate isomerase B